MKKLLCGVVTLVLGLSLSACSLQCLSGHTWEEATCTTPKTCSVCGKTDGERLSPDGTHQWEEATCTEPKTCKVCGETEGYSLDHDYNDKGECERCGAHKEYHTVCFCINWDKRIRSAFCLLRYVLRWLFQSRTKRRCKTAPV